MFEKSSKPKDETKIFEKSSKKDDQSKWKKIQVLKYNQAYMTKLGGYSYNLHEPTLEFYKAPFVYYGSVTLTFALVCSAIYLHENLHEVKEALEAFKIFAAGFQSGICSLVLAFQLRKIKVLHLKLQALVDEGIIFIGSLMIIYI